MILYYEIRYQNIDDTWEKFTVLRTSDYLWDNDSSLMDILDSFDCELSFDKFTTVFCGAGYEHKIKKLTKQQYDMRKAGY